jgi:hypothetical protein
MHENMHQILAQVNVLSFNQSNANGGCGDNRGQRTQGVAPQVFGGGQFDVHGGFAPATSGFAPGPSLWLWHSSPSGKHPVTPVLEQSQ